MIKIAINGFGRIGRCFLRAFYELGLNKNVNFELKCVNGTMSAEKCAHFLKYDSLHGIFAHNISHNEKSIFVDGQEILITNQTDIDNIFWQDIDLVIECSGKFNKKSQAIKHVQGGAKKVLVSAPCENADFTVIYGINENELDAKHKVVSVGSCTTNALLPIIALLHKNIGIVNGFFTTVHAYTNDQVTLDANHKDLRRGRAAGLSMIPTSTGANKLIAQIFPELDHKIAGSALRVPTPNVSMIDLKVNLQKSFDSTEQLLQIIKNNLSQFKNIIGFCNEPLVSIDFNHSSESSTIDSLETHLVDGNLARVVAWYDNEWGFTCRMIDVMKKLYSLV